MSLDETHDAEFVKQLAKLKPAMGASDPRAVFYEMGYAAASANVAVAARENPTTRGWLARVAAVAVCVTVAFLAGYAVRPAPSPAPSPTHSMVAERRQRAGDKESYNAVASNAAVKAKLSEQRSTMESQPVSSAFSSFRGRAEILSAAMDDPRDHRQLNAYGVSTAAPPIKHRVEGNIADGETLVSTLTRMDYLTWEDSL